MAKTRGRRKTTSLDGLVAELRELDARRTVLVGQLRQATESLFQGTSASSAPARQRAARTGAGRPRKKRTMSPEARERIRAAQKARWAKVRKAAGAAKQAR